MQTTSKKPSSWIRGTVTIAPEDALMGIMKTEKGQELFFETRCYRESFANPQQTLVFIKAGDEVVVKAREFHRLVLRPEEFYRPS